MTLGDPPAAPWPLFAAWYAAAEASAEIRYAAAMILATADAAGDPDARTVLLESWDEDGFVFFTDRESVKASQLAAVPRAALTFYWGPLERQIRLRGAIEPAPDEVSDACFRRRPRPSQITAWASRQSRPRGDLERRVEEMTARFAGQETVPRPPNWRAYRLLARRIEFWQAKAGRLHDRLLYSRGADGWTASWLDP